VGPGDRVANVAGLHFDQSTFELYAAPAAGATAVVVPDVALRFPASVVKLLDEQRTTIWYTVPHVLRQLVERGGLADRDWTTVRLVKYGGESCPPALLADLMRALPAATFSNVYGPAEVNQCTAYDLTVPPIVDEPVPIGHAWSTAEILLVDPDEPAIEIERGVGALLVATPTMMRGYWSRPDLDAERIIRRRGDDRRWYVTGDLVERGEDGLLRFVGRVDNQVKVRGQRVELEAVDAAIVAADGVRAGVAVVDRRDPAGDAVVAMVELESGVGHGGDVERRLSGEIGASLPAASAPTRVVIVDELPLTSSGKLDRGAAASRLHGA
ncbi:MAG: AMP-binding protein, partial [Actinomycetota bacterium]